MMAGLDESSLQSLDRVKELPARLRLLSEAMDYRLIRLKKGHRPPRAALRIAAALGLDPRILRRVKDH